MWDNNLSTVDAFSDEQARTLLDAVDATMPQYPLDMSFESAVPAELAEYYQAWKDRRPEPLPPSW